MLLGVSLYAPIIDLRLFGDIANEFPKLSPMDKSSESILSRCDQVLVPVARIKTYTAPREDLNGVLTRTVSPSFDIHTLCPNLSPMAISDETSLASCVQVVPERVNT